MGCGLECKYKPKQQGHGVQGREVYENDNLKIKVLKENQQLKIKN